MFAGLGVLEGFTLFLGSLLQCFITFLFKRLGKVLIFYISKGLRNDVLPEICYAWLVLSEILHTTLESQLQQTVKFCHLRSISYLPLDIYKLSISLLPLAPFIEIGTFEG